MKRLILLGIFTPFFCTAQISAYVKDSVSQQPIAYAAVMTNDNAFGTSTDSDGKFEIPTADASRGVYLQTTSYQTRTTTKLAQGDVIYLVKEDAKAMTPATLRNTETKRVGKIPENYDQTETSGIYTKPAIVANFFPYSPKYDKTPFLNKVIVNVVSKKEGAIYKLRIFEATTDGKPGREILTEPVIVSARKGDYNDEIVLANRGIRFSPNGLFIGVETIIIDQNLVKIPYKTDPNDDASEIVKEAYQPTFKGNTIGKGTLWRYFNGKWANITERGKHKTSHGKYFSMNNLYMEIELSN